MLHYKADVHRCQPSEVPATITAALAKRGATRIVVPDGLPSDWIADGIRD